MNETVTCSGAKALEQSGEHALYFNELCLGFTMAGNVDHLQITREEKKILEFTGGPHRNMQELAKLCSSPATAPFRNVRWNRTGCTPDLAAKPKAFVCWKLTRNLINMKNKLMAAAPNLELAEVLHFALSFHCANGTRNYLQLNTDNCQLTPGSLYAD